MGHILTCNDKQQRLSMVYTHLHFYMGFANMGQEVLRIGREDFVRNSEMTYGEWVRVFMMRNLGHEFGQAAN